MAAVAVAVADLRGPDRTIELADYRGGPIVLNFWASWCVPCRRDMPVAAGYGVFGMPTTVFISADGAVVAQHTGELSGAALEQAIDDHLGEP